MTDRPAEPAAPAPVEIPPATERIPAALLCAAVVGALVLALLLLRYATGRI